MGYKKVEQGQTTVFEIEPERVLSPIRVQPVAWVLMFTIVPLIFMFLLVVVYNIMFGPDFSSSVVREKYQSMTAAEKAEADAPPLWMIPVGFAIPFILYRLKKHSRAAKRYRAPSKFGISQDGISFAGKVIPRRDVHRVVVRNHILSENDSSRIVHEAGLNEIVVRSAAKYQRRLAEISYRVDLEAGGVCHTLAGGLNETTAFATKSDVSNALALA